MSKKCIVYLTGSRADFGPMHSVLTAIDQDSDFLLKVMVTGQHLEKKYGYTVDDIVNAGFDHIQLGAVDMDGIDGLEMVVGLALQMRNIASALKSLQPDLLILLGDRGEMLAGAIAALHLGIPTAHFHGGERSGTIDDPIRRAISSLSHFHFPATEKSRCNLIKLGEPEKNIFMLGAPGLDHIHGGSTNDLDKLRSKIGLPEFGDVALLLFHPVVQDSKIATDQVNSVMEVATCLDLNLVVMSPNSDAGSSSISNYYKDIQTKVEAEGHSFHARLHWLTHLERTDFISLVEMSKVMIGNSSSGIIEAASLRTPVVNIGDRQNEREINDSVFNCDYQAANIRNAIDSAMAYQGEFKNLYFAGGCAHKVSTILKSLDFGPDTLKKSFDY